MSLIRPFTAANGVVTYQSPLLRAAGVPHAFSTRIGGVSEGPFASLNLGNPSGVEQQDSTDNIRVNYGRLHAAIGCENRRRVFAHQVHGACVLDPATALVTDTLHGGSEIGKADAIVSDDPALLLSVRTADCVPILIATDDGKRVAAIHAGWRGVVAGVLAQTLSHFKGAAVRVAIGPHIGVAHFEVGPEVAQQFPPKAVAIQAGGRKPHIDLQQAILLQLRGLGITDDHIDTTDHCTVTRAEQFFSHRRDAGVTGRMASVVGAKA